MRFAFIVHVSRSGSTMLARHLAPASREIVVLPEFGLVDLLLAEGDAAVRRRSPDALLRLFTLDRQLPSLRLDSAALHRVARRSAGRGIPSVLRAFVDEYASGGRQRPSLAVIKRGSLIHHAAAIEELFPDAAYVHVLRDGRAVANSRLNTPMPYAPGRMMGRGDPWYVGRSWSRYVRRVRALEAGGPLPVVEVRYESLCLNPAAEVERLCRALGVCVTASRPRAPEPFAIVETEREIHRLVNHPPVLERLESWKTELPRWQGIAIEALQSADLRSARYPPHFTCGPLARVLSLAMASVLHWFRSAGYARWRLTFYLARPRLLGNRLRSRLARARHRLLRMRPASRPRQPWWSTAGGCVCSPHAGLGPATGSAMDRGRLEDSTVPVQPVREP